MPSEPLDPCPVCGGAPFVGHATGNIMCELQTAGPEYHIYSVDKSNHRRLCAEVALARVVMKHEQLFRVFAKHQRWDVAAAHNEIAEHVARVREASSK